MASYYTCTSQALLCGKGRLRGRGEEERRGGRDSVASYYTCTSQALLCGKGRLRGMGEEGREG